MFNVEHDAARPFIVETFACDVEVLGTKFNVTADELTHDFTTALLRGKVKVTNKLASGDQIILDPNEKVCLNGNRLVLTRIENTDDYLWTEGILNLVGHPVCRHHRQNGENIRCENPDPNGRTSADRRYPRKNPRQYGAGLCAKGLAENNPVPI